jgi:lipopolysaccharide export system protein LptC
MAPEWDIEREESAEGARRRPAPDLVAPRRIFKRKRNKGLILALKIVLPLIAVGCVAYIVIWSREVPVVHPIDMVGKVDQQKASDVTVKQVQYNGVDAHNRPFSITADSAVQPQASVPAPNADPGGDLGEDSVADTPPQPTPPADDKAVVINLTRPIADMTMSDGAWVAVTADGGVYHRDSGTVDLSGNVTLFHDTGLSFQTDAASVDLKNDTARGDQPVEGQNPNGELASQGFEVLDDGQTVVFTGRAYLKLYPKQQAGQGSNR